LFTEEVYDAAEILYSCLPNYSKVVACHLKQNSFSKAIEAAKKANNLKSWTDINISSVNAGDLSTAHIAGLHLLDHPDYLEELIRNYEYTGHFFELIELLEEGVANSHRPSVALLTELGIVYAKYNSEKLASFLRNSVLSTTTGKLNVPKLIRVCEKESLWSDCVYLHVTYGEFDQAASIMINHPSTWSHAEFISVIRNATNTELIYKALSFYLEIAPLQLCNLLMTLCSKLDHGRVVQQFRKCGHLKLIQKYLEHLQTNLQLDITVVNVALIEIYMEEQNFESLDKLIQNFKNFDQIALARDVESHESVALRKLAALLYRRNNRFNEAVTIFKKENMDMEAIEAAEASGNSEITEDLLRFLIVERKNINLFIVCLVRCYSLIRPDVVLELAWRYKCTEEIMPFLIQVRFTCY
jgi:clathrin heavy chain